MQPIDDAVVRTDSTESEYVPYADDVDDTQIDTEDERIINAAIRRYQMLGNELLDDRGSSPRSSTPKAAATAADDIDVCAVVNQTEPNRELNREQSDELEEKLTIEVPLPPPRRKSSANATQIVETINAPPLAEPETLSVASTQDLNNTTSEPVNDLSTENVQQPAQARVESLTIVNIQSTNAEPQESKTIVNALQITPEVMQEIVERVRETLPTQECAPSETPQTARHTENETEIETVATAKTTSDETKQNSDEPPKRPPSPVDYTPTSEIPQSFYRLKSGISDDESVPSIPPVTLPKHRPPRKHARHPDSSSSDPEDCNRRHHHHHSHHGAVATTSQRSQDLSIVDLSGLLIRACGRALSSTLSTAGHSLVDFIQSLTKNQDDHQTNLHLVLVILIIIVASLMMLGNDRSIHHHHHHFLNPPDHFGRQ